MNVVRLSLLIVAVHSNVGNDILSHLQRLIVAPSKLLVSSDLHALANGPPYILYVAHASARIAYYSAVLAIVKSGRSFFVRSISIVSTYHDHWLTVFGR